MNKILLFLILAIYTVLIVVGAIALKDDKLLRVLYFFLVLVGLILFTKVCLLHQSVFSRPPGSEIRIFMLCIIAFVISMAFEWIVGTITGNALYGEIAFYLMFGICSIKGGDYSSFFNSYE